VLRPGGDKLLVGESLYNRVLEFPVLAPGKLGPSRVFAELPAKGASQPDAKPDGMALDEAGNLYVAHYGMGKVQVYDTQGTLLASLPGAGVFTSNVAFGGPAMDDLFVTGSIGPTEQTTGMLIRLHLPGVKGLRILPPAP
jgi:gluconolactonase